MPEDRIPSGRVARIIALAVALAVPFGSAAYALPEIRTSERNRVPACVTPDRLMRFLTERNPNLDKRFSGIANYYKQHGEANRIRWDYAFFQMILETNYLLFKNGAGQGDVSPRQNNFAGIGTTGGGVPGDSFPDVSTGVLAQMQHLIAYSGERVGEPVGRRTREKQDDIIALSQRLGRPVTFRDLTRRWATDRKYGASIEAVATRFRADHCTGKDPEPLVAEKPSSTRRFTLAKADAGELPYARSNRGDATRSREEDAAGQRVAGAGGGIGAPPLVSPPAVAVRPSACRVYTASYGGQRNVLIKAFVGNELQYTALQVLDGQEDRLAESFIRAHARGGEALGAFPNREAALSRAFDLCPPNSASAD
ncbi:MAG TPA: glucosaminidase domain-containing protein [Hyphomicrobiaceae bacterium]|nr:glucosaminidase domain-containing protein [Hyphomicrobiaceae bacterium]